MRNEYIELLDRLCIVEDEVCDILTSIQAYITFIQIANESINKDENFILDMQNKQAVLLRLVNKLNDIAMKAMAINESHVVYRCEDVKLKVRNTMEVVRNLYM